MSEVEQILLDFLKEVDFGKDASKHDWASRSNKKVSDALDKYAPILQPTHPVDGELRAQIKLLVWGEGIIADINTDKILRLFDAHLQAAVRATLVDFVSWYNQNYDTGYSSGIAESRPDEYLHQLTQLNPKPKKEK